jgi:hypothetical protein
VRRPRCFPYASPAQIWEAFAPAISHKQLILLG